MSLLDSTKEALTRQMGPLPLYAWVGIAGLSYAVYRTIKRGGSGGVAASSSAGGASGSANQPGGASGTGGSGSGGGPGPGGGNNPPPVGNTTSAPGVSLKDLLGGSVIDFAKSLGPNYNSLSVAQDGTSIGTTNSAQNLVDAANYQADLRAKTQQALDTETYTYNLNQLYQQGALAAQANVNASNVELYKAYIASGGNPNLLPPGWLHELIPGRYAPPADNPVKPGLPTRPGVPVRQIG